jgi:hypothetical protein
MMDKPVEKSNCYISYFSCQGDDYSKRGRERQRYYVDKGVKLLHILGNEVSGGVNCFSHGVKQMEQYDLPGLRVVSGHAEHRNII